MDYGWPGPDTTHLLVKSVNGDELLCWDLWFAFDVTAKVGDVRPVSRMYPKLQAAYDEALDRFLPRGDKDVG